MPQGRAELWDKFPEGDADAFRVLDRYGIETDRGGMILIPKSIDLQASEHIDLADAVEHLTDEWDYDWEFI